MTNAGENMGKRNTCSLLMGVPTGTATVEIGVEVSQKAIKDLPQDSAKPLMGIYPADSVSYTEKLVGSCLQLLHSQ